MHTTRKSQSLGIFFIAAVVYATFYAINDALIRSLDHIPGADLFRLSSGVKLLLVLLTGWIGAAAIASFCFIWSALFVFADQQLLAAQVAIAGGLAPLLCCLAFRNQTRHDLTGLTWQRLFQLSLMFATLNSVLREGIIFMHLRDGDLMSHIGRAFVSDLLGIFAALYAFRFVLIHVDLPRPQSK